MSGRGDKNKQGTSGRGSSDQSNQPFPDDEGKQPSGNKNQTGGKPSEPSPRTVDQDSQRDLHLKESKRKEKG